MSRFVSLDRILCEATFTQSTVLCPDDNQETQSKVKVYDTFERTLGRIDPVKSTPLKPFGPLCP